MSSPGNNQNERKLKDFLDRKTDGEPDAFDKEALEGFSMLDRDESLRLKQSLDKKMADVLNASGDNKTRPMYWIAVAAMLIIVGFSTYLILENDSVVPKKDIVVHTPGIPSFEQRGAPAMDKQPAEKEIPVISLKEKEEKRLALKDQKVAPDQEAVRASGEDNPVSETAAPENDMAYAEKKEEVSVNAFDQTESAGATAIQPATSPAAPAQKQMAGKNQKQVTDERTQKSKRSDPPASAAFESASSPSLVNYRGGTQELNADLHKLLDKNSDLRFDAIIFLNADLAVQEVKFVETFGMRSKQENEIKSALKKLDKFEIEPGHEAIRLFEFVIKYRP